MFPTLPDDVAITFYVQSHKLILAVYQSITTRGSNTKSDAYQAECTIPWLNEVLVLFTVALQLCQQLKDKVSAAVFHFKRRSVNFMLKFSWKSSEIFFTRIFIEV